MAALFGSRRDGLLQLEVKGQLGITPRNITGTVVAKLHVAHQAFAGGIGKVVPQVFVPGQVDREPR